MAGVYVSGYGEVAVGVKDGYIDIAFKNDGADEHKVALALTAAESKAIRKALKRLEKDERVTP